MSWMGFELFFGFLGVPEHDQKTSFFLEWVRALSGGLGTQFDASRDPKNRSRSSHLGYLWSVFWGTRFLTVFSSLCFVCSIVPTLRLYRCLQCFKHFSMFRNCRKIRATTHRNKHENLMENRWKNPPKTVTPDVASNKTSFFTCFRSRGHSGTISGSSRGK